MSLEDLNERLLRLAERINNLEQENLVLHNSIEQLSLLAKTQTTNFQRNVLSVVGVLAHAVSEQTNAVAPHGKYVFEQVSDKEPENESTIQVVRNPGSISISIKNADGVWIQRDLTNLPPDAQAIINELSDYVIRNNMNYYEPVLINQYELQQRSVENE